MINPNDPQHLARLGRSADGARSELTRFHLMRANTVNAYLGMSSVEPDYDWGSGSNRGRSEYEKGLPQGNLLQMSGLSTQISLAYGEPQFFCQARIPEHVGTSDRMEPALNRMAMLLDLGETARKVAADSFFGYGIFKVGVGSLPKSAQAATGLDIGPCVWRVSQPNFIYDITVDSFEKCGFMGDLYQLPLNEAIKMYPHAADRLTEITDADYSAGAYNGARTNRYFTPEPMVQLFDGYLPGSDVVCTWVIRARNMRSLSEKPIAIRDYNGHWSGIYSVLNHLYSPDDLVPVAQAESVKAIHYLFNDILALTSEQARNAKYNPTYQQGSERDMKKLFDADDRVPVALQNLNATGEFKIPGPDQSQTQYMAALMGMFKQMSLNLDERLGLGASAPTARQGAQITERTNTITAEARRKFLRCLQLVGYKLGHLLMEDQNLYLPLYRQLQPGSDVQVDVSWMPASRDPRQAKVDDFDLGVESYSLKYREPEERLQQISAIATGLIIPVLTARAQGVPINPEKVLETAAKYSGNPELRDWFEEVDPLNAVQKQEGQQPGAGQRPDVGHYIRENVSEQTSDGQMQEAMNNMPTEETGGGQQL